MTRVTQVENEARVLAFRRQALGPGVQIAHVSLRRGESSLTHSHSQTRDTFYVFEGRLTISVYEQRESQGPRFWTNSSDPGEIRREGELLVRRFGIKGGEVFVVEPRVVHCAANLHEQACSFLCIEGIGEYDFVLAEGLQREV